MPAPTVWNPCQGEEGLVAYKAERNLWDVGDDKKDKNHEAYHGHGSLGYADDVLTGDATGDEEVDAHGRREEADCKVDNHDDAEVERGNAHAGDNRQQDRGENDDGCQSFHEHANDEEQDVDDKQDEELAVREIKDGAGNGAGHVLDGHDVAEDGGHGHQENDGGRGLGCANTAFEQLLP